MTETEWFASSDLYAMLQFLEGKISNRKVGLFVCACCRRIWHYLNDPRSRKAVETWEWISEGVKNGEELRAVMDAAAAVFDPEDFYREPHETYRKPELYAASAAHDVIGVNADEVLAAIGSASAASAACGYVGNGFDLSASNAEILIQCHLLRDIVGNPFHPVAFKKSWLTKSVVSQANTAYQENRLTEYLPGLADALEEAGCSNTEILNHCRHPGLHVRGCWVADLLLNKN